MTKLIAINLMLLLAFARQTLAAEAPESKDCRVRYSAPTVVPIANRIVISTGKNHNKLEERGGIIVGVLGSPTALTYMEPPDFNKPGPWNTTLAVFRHGDHPLGLTIKFVDHGSTPVAATWLNAKLVALRVWWGQTVSTDLILDIEKGELIHVQEADYSQVATSCNQNRHK